jgi:hypothetical protein
VIAEDHCVTSLAKALITSSRHASTPRDRREYFLSRFSESRFISALEHELAFPADKPTDEKKRPRLDDRAGNQLGEEGLEEGDFEKQARRAVF